MFEPPKRNHPLPIYFKPLPPLELILSIVRYDPDRGRFYYVRHGIDRGKLACGQRGDKNYRYLNFGKADGGSFFAHRVAWKVMTGCDPTGVIDHKNGHRDDNRIANLRDVTAAVNSQNNHGDLWACELRHRKEAVQNSRIAKRQHRLYARSGAILGMMGMGC